MGRHDRDYDRPSGLLVAAIVLASASLTPAADGPVTVYVGTYTDGTSKGIYRFSLDLDTGKASAPALAGEAKNPSFLALHPSGRFLYAVSEVGDFGGAKTGSVIAFAVDPKTGDLTKLNEVASEGGAPCHLVVDKAGKNVLVANYGGGTVAVLPIGADGRLQKASAVRTHEGKGPNAQRQDKPHAHGIYLDAAERFALSPDLGADRVFVYALRRGQGRTHAPRRRRPRAGLRPAPPVLPPVGPLRLRDQRAELDRLGVRLRRRRRASFSRCRRSRRCRMASRARATPRRSRSPRTAASSTARTAATTASPCSRSTPPADA